MIQELVELRASLKEGRYEDAIAIAEDLELMGRKAIIRNIRSYLTILFVHLIKNQVEGRLTNSWAVSIRRSLVEIGDLNAMEKARSHYVKRGEWDDLLQAAFNNAIAEASLEVLGGRYKPKQLQKQVNASDLFQTATAMLELTYLDGDAAIEGEIDRAIAQLPGGEYWLEEE